MGIGSRRKAPVYTCALFDAMHLKAPKGGPYRFCLLVDGPMNNPRMAIRRVRKDWMRKAVSVTFMSPDGKCVVGKAAPSEGLQKRSW